jgi:transposase-like protein
MKVNEALEMVKQVHPVDGKDGVLASLTKQLVKAALESEIESHLSYEFSRSHRLGGNAYGRR